MCFTVNGVQTLPEEAMAWRCGCGQPLTYSDADFSFASDSKLPGIWRYASSLPVAKPDAPVTLGEGMTPLAGCLWDYGKEKSSILYEFDALNPTGSYKDRGIAVQIIRLKELWLKRLVEGSSGNAGTAAASYSAVAGMECDIYVPDYTSEGKCVQIAAYGAALHRIPGSREDQRRRKKLLCPYIMPVTTGALILCMVLNHTHLNCLSSWEALCRITSLFRWGMAGV